MTTFKEFKNAVNEQFKMLADCGELFKVNVTKDELWDVYLESFPDGTNPIFRERTEHDCQACKQFIRAAGGVVSINNDFEVSSIWDINIEGHYQVVANEMSEFVKARTIKGIFRHFQKNIGIDHTYEGDINGPMIQWDHLHFRLPKKFVKDGSNRTAKIKERKTLLERALNEFTIYDTNTVIELINQGTLDRGDEHLKALESFKKTIKEKNKTINTGVNLDNWMWIKATSRKAEQLCRIRNTVIGSLLIDVAKDMDLSKAVFRFNHKMDPTRYHQPTSVATKSMIKSAQKEITELGYLDSLPRRHAVIDDITINNVLWANPDSRTKMNVFDELIAQTPPKNLDKIEEVSIRTFINKILPECADIELLFSDENLNNLMTLVAPVNSYTKGILKWGNNFSWAYRGELADSMKKLVQKMGGKTEGCLRYSIKWNDGDNNQNDFDAHCIEPDRNKIFYANKRRVHPSSGMLDVDIISPGSVPAVENIIYSDIDKMQEGDYELIVHNYNHNGGTTGFTAEVEFGGKIYSFSHDKNIPDDGKVLVATVRLKDGVFKINPGKSLSKTTELVWGINQNSFHKVKMIMNSPNHWDGEETGNKHIFFILENCKAEGRVRGFFNEFLNYKLLDHRKVFQVLGSKMIVPESDDQLSGIGFSSASKGSFICKVTGAFKRTIKVNL